MEMGEMNEPTINAISIILLLLGSLFMLTTGFGLIPLKYAISTGVLCFIVSAFTGRIFKKKT
jgi:hypothetical protein